MPTYSYSCSVCGGFDRIRPMAEAGEQTSCPGCDRPSRRIFAAPALQGMNPALRGALDAQVRSADAPQVVSTVPRRDGADRGRVMRRATDPRQARLPRP